MQEVIQQLEALVKEYAEKLSSISEDELVYKPSPLKWSRKEIIGHLVDSAQNNIQRFVRVQYESQPHIVYNQDVWVSVQDYQHYPVKELIQLWKLLNTHLSIILQHIPENMYNRYVNTGKTEDQLHTVHFLAKDYAEHHLHHLKQIFQI